MTRFKPVAGLVFVWLVLMAMPAAAQSAGVRVGASIDPDQFYFGGHLETGPLVEELRFRPNVEIGLGDNLTLVALNFEFVYPFVLHDDWDLYAGAGPALNIYNHEIFGTDSRGGFNLLVGVVHRGGLFTELKIGTIDSPDVKIGVGYQFRWR
jgi:hypothetical protein